MAIKIEPVNSYKIGINQKVDLKITGTTTEVKYNEHKNREQNIKRIDKEHYQIIKTGEIKEVKHKESRANSKDTVRNTFKTLREYINANATNVCNSLWVTLTYKENMTDKKQVDKDLVDFIKAIRKLKKDRKIEYINVFEPQGRGAWHCHCILIFDEVAPYISNKKIAECWGHGNTKTKRAYDFDNLGAYLTAYLSDMELKEVKKLGMNYNEKDIKEVEIDNKKKKVVKNARLALYKPGERIFSKSNGVKKPTIVRDIEYGLALKKIGQPYPTFVKGFKIIIRDKDRELSNLIYKEFYDSRARYVLQLQENGTYKRIPNKWKDKQIYLF